MNEEIIKALARLETKVETIEKTITEMKTDLRQSKIPMLPVTGGLVGIAAAVWTGYLQASGQA